MEYQVKQLPIVLVPMIFTLAAMVAAVWMPDWLPGYWGVTGGMLWMACAWAVWQVRVGRAQKGLGREGQA